MGRSASTTEEGVEQFLRGVRGASRLAPLIKTMSLPEAEAMLVLASRRCVELGAKVEVRFAVNDDEAVVYVPGEGYLNDFGPATTAGSQTHMRAGAEKTWMKRVTALDLSASGGGYVFAGKDFVRSRDLDGQPVGALVVVSGVEDGRRQYTVMEKMAVPGNDVGIQTVHGKVFGGEWAQRSFNLGMKDGKLDVSPPMPANLPAGAEGLEKFRGTPVEAAVWVIWDKLQGNGN